MSSKRRVAAAASPETRLRGQKRRKVSDDDLVEPEEPNHASSNPRSESAEQAEADGTPDSEGELKADFEGDSLQTAQDKIMSELTRLRDSDDQEVSFPFIGKPDRNLYRDYYEIIQHPVSLRSIQKKVRGTDSRKNSSKTTAYPTWQSFEEEVSYIWRNAREYNEDGSEISNLAGILEDYFKRRVAEAKKLVPDPIQVDKDPEMPRIKLKMGPRMSDTPSKNGQQSGVTVDNESLERQQELVKTGSTSQDVEAHRMSPRTRSLRKPLASPRSSAATTPSAPEHSQTVPTRGRDLLASKGDTSMASSQFAEIGHLYNAPGISGEPPADIAGHSLSSAGGLISHDVPASLHPPPSVSPMDSILRRPGQDASSALIRNVQILSHSSLSLHHDFCLDIPPSSTVSQQTITVSLPASHHLLTIRPHLAAGTAQQQVKLVAFLGMQRLHPSGDTTTLSYDIQLHPGTIKVDLEAIVGPARGVPKSGPPGSDVDYERVSIFFNLLR
ncbi:hypothetical protein NUU61_007098 [Penicillium alfredii]|uniref:Bromo domain-containing protein n=1 Tax=Penicillium alfredii TaxID=1506179 RepID=A0A9W9F224_9EURO|nr:uncharacterized protein NUU61_007098 [Penicillium alfredii]KAJ5092228.1 hypothetical protein NUU61_007098 [Penicillium alfredii]